MTSTFEDCIKRLREAAAIANTNAKLVEELCNGGQITELNFPAMTLQGKEYFEAVRIHQIDTHEPGQPHPAKGGWRYAEYETKEEMIDVTQTLTMDMADKIALTGLPFKGAKGCLNLNTSKRTTDELWSITNALTLELLVHNLLDADIDVPGPDYGTNAEIMKWMYRFYGKLNTILHRPNAAAVVTGKPIDFDGCPGREDATARGGLIVYNQLVKTKNVPKVALQGFGNVGVNCFNLLTNKDFDYASGIIVAVSDVGSGLYNPNGLSTEKLFNYYQTNKTFEACKLGDAITPEQIVTETESDLFITAAREKLIHKNNAALIKTKRILELGNSAITYDADKILEDRGILVIPDVIANPGGVIASGCEWRKNRGDVPHEVDEADVRNDVYKTIDKILTRCVKKVLETKDQYGISTLRLAAKVRVLKEIERMVKRRDA